jgi:hypothetical protein
MARKKKGWVELAPTRFYRVKPENRQAYAEGKMSFDAASAEVIKTFVVGYSVLRDIHRKYIYPNMVDKIATRLVTVNKSTGEVSVYPYLYKDTAQGLLDHGIAIYAVNVWIDQVKGDCIIEW